MNISNVLLPIFVGFLVYAAIWLWKCGSRPKHYPPGPPTAPIVGNLFILPESRLHLKFSEWAKEYGDIFSLKMLDKTMIVLNTPSAMREIFERHSLVTSNRPKSIIGEMIHPNSLNLGTSRHANSTWKVLRRAASRALNSDNLKKMSKLQHAEAMQLMWDFSHTPDQWFRHIQRFTASYVLGLVYGKRSPLITSPDFSDFLQSHALFQHALDFGTMPPVDFFPILAVIPERWAKWKQLIQRVKGNHRTLYNRMLSNVENRLKRGQGIGVFMEEAIQNAEEWGFSDRDLLMYLGGVLLEGSDTSSSTLQTAVLILACYPDVQRKAQEEIDRVMGLNTVPTLEDIVNLPYTSAVVQEIMRFRPVDPLGLPHEMVNDEIIDGVFFPKDATVFLNIWNIFHDERYYDKPDEFIPERFLTHPYGIKPGITDDPARRGNILFGAGRRVCPGIQLANTSIELDLMNILWGFEILPSIDPVSGDEIKIDLDDNAAGHGILAAPKAAPLRIRPRSEKHRRIIDEQFAKSANILSTYELELNEEEREFNRTYRDNIIKD